MLFTVRGIFLRPYTASVLPRANYSTHLTHVTGDGKAQMVDVGHKVDSRRTATAKGRVYVGPVIYKLIQCNEISKGDVLSVAKLSGIINAKRTSDIIPLCHNIPIDSIKVDLRLVEESAEVDITATAKCSGKTGVEMEALVAVATAALTIYDMCKAVSQDMVIREIHLVHKSGGKTDYNRTDK